MKKDDGSVVPLGGGDPSWKVENNVAIQSLVPPAIIVKVQLAAAPTGLVTIYKDTVNEYIFVFWGKAVILLDYDWNFRLSNSDSWEKRIKLLLCSHNRL